MIVSAAVFVLCCSRSQDSTTKRAASAITGFRTTEARLHDRQAHSDQCWQLLSDQNDNESCAEFRRALARNIRELRQKSAEGNLRQDLAAGLLLQGGRPSAALLELEGLRSESPQLLIVAGASYLERARREEAPLDTLRALDALAKATEAADESPAAWFNLGLAASELRLCTTADRSLRSALSHDTDEGWRAETRRRIQTASCRMEHQPVLTTTVADEKAWRRLEFDQLFEEGRFEEIVHRAAREERSEHGHRFHGRLRWIRGTAEMGLGELGNALASFEAALAHFEHAKDLPRQGAVHSLLASAYSVAGNWNESWRHRRLALDLLQRTGWRHRLNVALNSIAYEAFEEGLYSAARVILEEIRSNVAPTAETERATNGLYRARALAALGQAQAAEELLREFGPSRSSDSSRASLEQLGVLQLREGETLRFMRRYGEALSVLTSAITWLKEREEVLTLVGALAERSEVYLALVDFDSARRDLGEARRILEQERRSLTPFQRPAFLDATARVADLAIRVELAVGDASTVLAKLEEATARTLRDALSTHPRKGRESRLALDKTVEGNVVTLRYCVLEEELLLWRIEAGEAKLHRIPIRKNDLKRLVLNTASASKRGVTADEGLERLGRVLLGDLRPYNAPARVIVIPDDVLYAVPFAALRFPGLGQHLIEYSEVQIAPSLATAGSLSSRTLPRTSFKSLWVADAPVEGMPPLPAARQAAVEAGAAYRQLGEATLILGSDASIGAVTEGLRRANLVEIDVHSTSATTFLGSALHLASGPEGKPAVITADRIASLDLSNLQVAVLATCDSSNSRYRGSEGIGGLQWAFMAAGSEAVVSTLWAVQDADASRFTSRLHRHLLAGQPLSAAMRLASLESMGEKNPAWAAFAHYGGNPRLTTP